MRLKKNIFFLKVSLMNAAITNLNFLLTKNLSNPRLSYFLLLISSMKAKELKKTSTQKRF